MLDLLRGGVILLMLMLDLLRCGVILLLTLLATTSQSQHQVKGGLLLNVVIRQCATILQLLTSKDQSLLIWRNSLLVLNLSLYILDGIAGLHLKGDGFAREGLYKNLHGESCSFDLNLSLHIL